MYMQGYQQQLTEPPMVTIRHIKLRASSNAYIETAMLQMEYDMRTFGLDPETALTRVLSDMEWMM